MQANTLKSLLAATTKMSEQTLLVCCFLLNAILLNTNKIEILLQSFLCWLHG